MKSINRQFSIIKKKHLLLSLSLLLSFGLQAQAYLVPGADQQEPVLILGATAHIGNGEVIENSAILFEDGKITQVGRAAVIREMDKRNYRVIEALGKHVYPGFISPSTSLGLIEIGAVRATRDRDEVGAYNPNVRSLIAYNTDSRVIPTVRSNGVLMAQITPRGGRISGTSSIVQLDAWNWEDAAYVADDGIHLNWMVLYRRTGWWAEQGEVKRNVRYDTDLQELRRFFDEAQAYARKEKPAERNLLLEGMRGLFEGRQQLFIHADQVKSITEAVLFAEDYDLKPVIIGGEDAWMVTDFLKEKDIAVILDRTHRLPGHEHTDVDQPYKTPVLLHEAGIRFCMSIDGGDEFWQQRNLPFQIGQSVGYGLPYEAAVKAITLGTAEILDVAEKCGSLEEGKDATLFISEGDALDMRTNKVTHAFIQGRKVDLNNKQKMLYRKYKTKYKKQ